MINYMYEEDKLPRQVLLKCSETLFLKLENQHGIVPDHGTQFTNKTWKEILKKEG